MGTKPFGNTIDTKRRIKALNPQMLMKDIEVLDKMRYQAYFIHKGIKYQIRCDELNKLTGERGEPYIKAV